MATKVTTSNLATEDMMDNIYNSSEFSALSPRPYLNRRSGELRILALISSGAVPLLEEHMRRPSNLNERLDLGRLSEDPLTHAKYMGVIMTSLACRAAIDGGLPEHIAFNLSDTYIRKFDAMQNPGKVNTLIYEVMLESCKSVQSYQMGKLSPAVRKCCEYFYVKLHSTVTLDELSKVCYLSPNYISELFRKELGMGAIAYYQKKKLEFARYFLQHTNLSISDIAATLAYPSHSHFTQRFKQAFGMTPSQYREQLS